MVTQATIIDINLTCLQAPRGLSVEEKRVKLVEIFHETVRELDISSGQEQSNAYIQKDFFQVLWCRFYALARPHIAEGAGKDGAEDEGHRCAPLNHISRVIADKKRPSVSQSVKEVLQSLVDDGLVQSDKIGSSNCESTIRCTWGYIFLEFSLSAGRYCSSRVLPLRLLAETLIDVQPARHRHRKPSSSPYKLSELRSAIEAEKASRVDSADRAAALEQLAASKKELAELGKELAAYGACDPAKVEEKKRGVVLAKEAAVRWTDNYALLLSHFTRQNGVEASEVRKYLGVDEDYEDIEC
ncbi:Meiotic nuclear division protein 1 [Grifola frondosa]|uniref:Meiotic nuclear division protein 1 n=1 Tax=Grifola frondosa TaxID=5627 RepID=A0A1C7LT86_GRIFR|nr:Meiotic nuclear division protein 1 [Grifola frondosa]